MSQPLGAVKLETVDPHAYARAMRIEDRLIRLIDAGEDLAKWYYRPSLPVAER
jgi:hypothetical protein